MYKFIGTSLALYPSSLVGYLEDSDWIEFLRVLYDFYYGSVLEIPSVHETTQSN